MKRGYSGKRKKGKATAEGDSNRQKKRKVEKKKKSLVKKAKATTPSKKLDAAPSIDAALENAKSTWCNITRALPILEKHRFVGEILDTVSPAGITAVARKKLGSRILQTCFREGSAKQKSQIFVAILEDLKAVSESPFGSHLVKCIIRHCNPKDESKFVLRFRANATKLLRHKIGCDVLDTAYLHLLQNESDRKFFRYVFFNREALLPFDKADSDLRQRRSVAEAIKEDPADMRGKYLRTLRINISSAMERGILAPELLHDLAFEYATSLVETEREELTTLTDLLADHAVHIANTHKGSSLLALLIHTGDARLRKRMIKGFRSFVKRTCSNRYGHLVIVKLLRSVDDTVLLGKIILDELLKTETDSMSELFVNEYSLDTLRALLLPSQVNLVKKIPRLKETLEIPFSKLYFGVSSCKKPEERRLAELLEHSFRILSELALKNAQALLSTSKGHFLALDLVTYGVGERKALAHEFCSLILAPGSKELCGVGDDKLALLEVKDVNRIWKKYLKGDVVLPHQTEAEEIETGGSILRKELVSCISESEDESIKRWITGFAGSIVTVLLEKEDTSASMRSIIERQSIDKEMISFKPLAEAIS